MFHSRLKVVGEITEFPDFSGVRIMMMPVRLDDPDTLPIVGYRKLFEQLIDLAPTKTGVAYITIDEALVRKGETHRRPGLHVDGIGPDGRAAGWGGGGGGWGANGMLLVASRLGCVGWNQFFSDFPKENGECEHLREQCDPRSRMFMWGGEVFAADALAVHEALPMENDVERQFVRLSMPNDCPWYEGYTENPLGVKPTGPIHSARSEFMAYRA